MRAIVVENDVLVWGNAPEPTPGSGEILIRNRATAINRADLAQRSGRYPPPAGASPIMGLECAGEVIKVGEGVASFKPGDLVCALLAGGGYAELVAVPAGQALPLPKGLDCTQAASLPEVFATAFLNLFIEGQLQLGERVVLHAGASGVGTAGIQLCRAFGSPCFVTAGSDDKVARCIALGAADGVNRHSGSFRAAVATWTNNAGCDVILDPVGASYLADNLASLAVDGRLVIIGLMGGVTTELNIGALMMKRLRIIGSTLRARSVSKKAEVMDHLRRRVWPLIANGEIKPVIEAVMPITEAEAAHKLIAGDQTFGKVVLTIPQ